MKENRKKKAVIAGAAVIVICIAVFALLAGENSSVKRIEELLDLGNRYLTEQDYEEAVASFQEVIEIDPKCEEAYLRLADVYIAMDDYESAMDILQRGIEQTGAEELKTYLSGIKEVYTGIQEQVEAEETNEKEATETEDKIREKPSGKVAIRIIGNTQGTQGLRSGYVTEKDANGKIVTYMEYTEFNGERIYEAHELPEWLVKTEYKYDVDGNVVKATYYPEGYSYYTVYEYDEHGNVIRDMTFNSEGRPSSEGEYEYDDYGNMVRESIYDNGKLSAERMYLWECEDENGEIKGIEVNEFEYSGADLVRETFYGESGEVLMENLY